MSIKSAFKKAVHYLAGETPSYTLTGVLIGEKNQNHNNYMALTIIPFNKGGRLTERAITIGGTAVAAFALASVPAIGALSVTSFIGYAALSKVAGILTGAVVDTQINNADKKLKTPTA